MKNEVFSEKEINNLYIDIRKLIEQSRDSVYKTINAEMVNLYWNIGKMIFEKQECKNRAIYGEMLIDDISKRLTEYYGKGFSKRSLERMRKFYLMYPIAASIMPQLSWTHYLELIKIKEKYANNFYIPSSESENSINLIKQKKLIFNRDKFQ